MSVFAGPTISNDGLVFYYDINNTEKSWKGKPTVNTCGFVDYTYGYNSTKIIGATPPVPPPIQATTVYKITSSDGNDGQQILYTAGVDQINGGTYTHSAYVYLESGSWVSVGQHWNPWDYGTQQYIPLGRWIRVEDPVTNDPNNYGNVALSYNTNGAVYVTASQYEIGSFATPFVLGTRSNTQAILDLTGRNTITAQNLSYSSDGTFSFDGTDDYIDITNNLGVFSQYTFSYWARRDAENRMPIGWRAGPTFYWYGDNSWYYTHGGVAGEYYYSKPTSIPLGTWGHYCVVYNGSNVSIYRQGVFQGSKNTTGTADWTNGVRIGYWAGGGSYWYQGIIAQVSMHNRALSATEVLQNFNALRGRYGI